MGDGFYRSKDPTNSIKVLKEHIVQRRIKHTISRHEHTYIHTYIYEIYNALHSRVWLESH